MQYLFALTLLFAPAYALKFGIFGAPSNVLMVWLGILWIIFAGWLIYKQQVKGFLGWLGKELKTAHGVFALLFLLAGLLSVFVGGVSEEKVGQLLVLFVQPIGSLFMLRYLRSLESSESARTHTYDFQKAFVVSAFALVAATGVYAIIQYFTLVGVPEAWWGNATEPKRALAFFLHPNFYALFVTPFLAFLLPFIVENENSAGEQKGRNLFPLLSWLLGAVGLLLSLSRGGWLGLAAASAVYVIIIGSRRLFQVSVVAVILAALIVLSVPNFRYRLMLPFQGEKSAVSRFSLWHTGIEEIKDNPITGKGLLGFKSNWYTYNTDPNLEPHPTPHNLYLALWVDTGILGLISFLMLCAIALWAGFRKNHTALQLGSALAVVAVLIHGFVDTPYLKNDLALLFWLLYSFI